MYINKKNIAYFFTILLCLFLVMVIPSLIPLQSDGQKQIVMQHNNAISQSATVTSIFNNNLKVAGLSLIPVVGWGILLATVWNTGVVVASYSYPWYWIFTNQVGVFAAIEFSVCSYMLLRSIKLFHLFKQRKTRFTNLDGVVVVRKTTGVWPEIVKTIAYAFIFSSIVLLCSALLEFLVIRGLL